MVKIKYSFADTDSLRDYVSEVYNIPISMLDLHRDVRGAVYIAYSQERKYVFKLSHTYYRDKSVNAVNLINFLRTRNFPAVGIIPTAKGEQYVSISMPEGIRIGVLYEFAEGRAATFDDIEEIGKLGARMHNEMSSYTGTMPLLYSKPSLIDELPKMLRTMRYNEANIIEIERVGNIVWDRVKDHQPIIAHGDFDKNNIIITDDGSATLLDFDDAGQMPLIFDVACICNRIDDAIFTKEGVEQTEKTVELFLKGYNALTPHLKPEISDIFNWLAVRRIDLQMIGIRFYTVKLGRTASIRFWDMLYKWLMDWKKMFG